MHEEAVSGGPSPAWYSDQTPKHLSQLESQMSTDFSDSEDILHTLVRILEAEGLSRAAKVVRDAEARFEHSGYDNWNGGTNLYTLFLMISPESFAGLGGQREELEKAITARIKPVIDSFSSDWVAAQIRPSIRSKDKVCGVKSVITDVTRRDIIDYFTVSGTAWSGGMDEADFLERLYSMEEVPSTDPRYKSAAGDIYQHRVNNLDWPDDWVFDDERFGLAASDEKLLRFLAETVHPVVRRDKDEVLVLVQELNNRLRQDGWELAEAEKISGRSCYAAQRIRSGAVMAVTRARVAADVLDAAWMHGEIARMTKAADADPSLAIGTAKELVETCCKTILSRRNVEIPKGADLPKLVKMTATELQLIPDGISEAAKGADVIRSILRNLATLTQSLAELRSLYGTGHGRDGKYRGLQPRHARLAVASAIAFVDFVVETFREREGRVPKPSSALSSSTP